MSRFKTLILATFFSLTLVNASLYGQMTARDSSIVDSLLTKSWGMMRKDPQGTLRLLHRIDSFQNSFKPPAKFFKLVYYYGIVYKNLARYDSSEYYLDQYLQHYIKSKNLAYAASAYMAKANLYSDQSLWDKSMHSVTQAIDLFDQLKDTSNLITANSKLGYLLSEVMRAEEAIIYHRHSLQLAEHIKDSVETTIALSNIGLAFQKINQYDSAHIYFLRSKAINELIQDQEGLIYDYYNLGSVYLNLRQLKEAEAQAQAGISLLKAVPLPDLKSSLNILLADIYLASGRIRQGINLLEQELKNTDADLSLKKLSESYFSLYQAHQELGQIQPALTWLEKHTRMKDSLLNDQITSQVNNLEVKYNSDKQAQEIKLLNTQSELTSLKLRAANTRNILFGIGLLVLSVLILLIYRLWQRTKVQNNQIKKALQEKEILIREIHHRVKNNLQFISSLLNLQARHVTDAQASSVLKEGQNRVKSMALIHQNLYQEKNLTGVETQKYFETLINNLFQSYNISPQRIKIVTEIDVLNLDVDTMIPIGLVLNELISNCLKYAFPEDRSGQIIVRLKEEQDALALMVTDDGIGMTAEVRASLGRSFGYRLINAFKSQLNAELDIKSQPGTTVTMSIKDYQKVA